MTETNGNGVAVATKHKKQANCRNYHFKALVLLPLGMREQGVTAQEISAIFKYKESYNVKTLTGHMIHDGLMNLANEEHKLYRTTPKGVEYYNENKEPEPQVAPEEEPEPTEEDDSCLYHHLSKEAMEELHKTVQQFVKEKGQPVTRDDIVHLMPHPIDSSKRNVASRILNRGPYTKTMVNGNPVYEVKSEDPTPPVQVEYVHEVNGHDEPSPSLVTVQYDLFETEKHNDVIGQKTFTEEEWIAFRKLFNLDEGKALVIAHKALNKHRNLEIAEVWNFIKFAKTISS